jgi:hypothetical protein
VVKTSHPAIIVDNLSHHAILGCDFLNRYNVNISYGNSAIEIPEHGTVPFQLKSSSSSPQLLSVNTDEHSVLKFRSMESTDFAPNQVKEVKVRFDSKLEFPSAVLIEIHEQLLERYGVIMKTALVELEGRAELELILQNCDGYQKTLPRGIVIGIGEVINHATVSHVSEIPHSTHPTRNLTAAELAQLDFNPALPDKDRKALVSLLTKYGDCFGWDFKTTGNCTLEPFQIDTGANKPIYTPPYRQAPMEKENIRAQIEDMLRNGLIEPSNSPWASPVLLVPKKNGKLRFCIDYRALNKLTRKDRNPLTRIDDILDSVQSAKIYSTLDLYAGYHQLLVDERDREKTAFIVPEGLYQFRRMPFGLCNAPAVFSRAMNTCMDGLTYNSVLVYLDDFVIPGTSFLDHLRKLERVLLRLRKYGLTLQPTKCSFGYPEVKLLGHVVNEYGVKVDPDKINAVANFPRPSSIKEARSFHGLANYYRRFCSNFADVSRPLVSLWKGDQKFRWEQEQEDSFRKLQTMLTSAPCLAHYDPSLPSIVHCDSSGYGTESVLLQVGEDKLARPVAYASRTFTDVESRYSTTEKELLALIYAARRFRCYLFRRPFVVRTDHHSLCFVRNMKDPSSRLDRFAIKLQPFDYTIQYKNGKHHLDADCLSRGPAVKGNETDEIEDNFVDEALHNVNAVDVKDIPGY